MGAEEIPAQAEIDSKAFGYLPVILNEPARLVVAPRTDVCVNVRCSARKQFRVNTCSLNVGQVCREEERVKEVIAGAAHIKLAVLVILFELRANFHRMLPLYDGNQVLEIKNVFIEELRVSVIGAE